MPGMYYYQYTLTNPDGYSAVPVNLTVQIYEQVCPPPPLAYQCMYPCGSGVLLPSVPWASRLPVRLVSCSVCCVMQVTNSRWKQQVESCAEHHLLLISMLQCSFGGPRLHYERQLAQGSVALRHLLFIFDMYHCHCSNCLQHKGSVEGRLPITIISMNIIILC